MYGHGARGYAFRSRPGAPIGPPRPLRNEQDIEAWGPLPRAGTGSAGGAEEVEVGELDAEPR